MSTGCRLSAGRARSQRQEGSGQKPLAHQVVLVGSNVQGSTAVCAGVARLLLSIEEMRRQVCYAVLQPHLRLGTLWQTA